MCWNTLPDLLNGCPDFFQVSLSFPALLNEREILILQVSEDRQKLLRILKVQLHLPLGFVCDFQKES